MRYPEIMGLGDIVKYAGFALQHKLACHSALHDSRQFTGLCTSLEQLDTFWAHSSKGLYLTQLRAAGDLATLFMLEDRVTKRTQAGQDSNEFDPTSECLLSLSPCVCIIIVLLMCLAQGRSMQGCSSKYAGYLPCAPHAKLAWLILVVVHYMLTVASSCTDQDVYWKRHSFEHPERVHI